jgi:predicted nucleic acid-binding protein
MILVDTSVWIDYFNGSDTVETSILDTRLGLEPLLIGDLILVEVLQGFRSQAELTRAARLLAGLEFRELVGRQIALKSASNYRSLRARGMTVRKTIDVIIGTWCIVNSHQLLHSDRDFDVLEQYLGLQVVRK